MISFSAERPPARNGHPSYWRGLSPQGQHNCPGDHCVQGLRQVDPLFIGCRKF